ncbi:hypothetical protein D5085_11685 [Ectothiorhodospiraceae bacterium BW-2]|nr:hypothetical protein D5085_11685 [Ectothiorhodospiraceae bacterium BW-2]
MNYRLIAGLLSVLVGLPSLAAALGLGEIRLYSALNQQLNAEIELLSAEPDDLNRLSINLASHETFAKLGLERPQHLLSLRFQVEPSLQGKAVVRITSQENIREPFLDFVIEALWPGGRVLREYTLLLDPPEYNRNQPVRVAAQPLQPPPEWGGSGRGASVGASASGETFTYGPVRRGDTLWRIAGEYRSNQQASRQQIMQALFRENPEAFMEGDINRLKQGVILRLSEPALVASMASPAAIEALRRQSEQERLQMAAEAEKRQPEPAPEKPPADRVVAQRPNVKLVSPSEGGRELDLSGSGEGDNDKLQQQLRQELLLALETSEAQRQENSELRQRLGELQQQLEQVKRLIALKNPQLAQLQQLAGNDEVPPTDSAVVETPSVPAPMVEAVATATDPDSDLESVEGSETRTDTGAEAEAEAETRTETDIEAIAVTATALQVEPPSPPPPPPPPARAAPSALDWVMANLWLVGSGAALVLILLTLVITIMRRRRGFQESILSNGGSLSVATTFDGGSGPDTSFMSDLAISGLSTIGGSDEGSSVDPLTEADVYMAYGRIKQAEELLSHAIEKEPDRLELKVKMLEVYYLKKDQKSFDKLLLAAGVALQEQEELWRQVVPMGREISPDNPLFANVEEGEFELPPGVVEGEGSDKPSIFDDVLDIGIDLDELSAEMESAVGDDLDIDLGIDFSELGDTFGGTATEAVKKGGDSEMDALLNFTVEELELERGDSDKEKEKENSEATKPSVASGGVAAAATMDMEDSLGELLNLDLNLESSPPLTEESERDTDEEAPLNLDDLADLDLTLPDENDSPSGEAELDFSLELDQLALEQSDVAAAHTDNGGGDALPEFNFDDLDIDLTELEGIEATPPIPETDASDALLDLSELELDSLPEVAEDESELAALAQQLDLGEGSGDDFLTDLGEIPDFDAMFGDDLTQGESDSSGESVETKLDLARAYMEMEGGDADARSQLQEVLAEGSEEQKHKAQQLLDKLG